MEEMRFPRESMREGILFDDLYVCCLCLVEDESMRLFEFFGIEEKKGRDAFCKMAKSLSHEPT